MDAHRVKIFNRADDDALVLIVAHHFHLVFLPAEQTFLDQHLMRGRNLQPVGHHRFKFFLVVGDAATRAAEGETWPNNKREFLDGLGRNPDTAARGEHRRGCRHVPVMKIAFYQWIRRLYSTGPGIERDQRARVRVGTRT